jgi:uncharacterized membrane protein (UPF0127 family)
MNMLLLKRQDGVTVADNVVKARTFRTRALGLLTRRSLDARAGLLFEPGGSIHTFGMRFTIDVAFLDRDLRVLKACGQVRPWRMRTAPRHTRYTLELSAGRLATAAIVCGTCLRMEENRHGEYP